MSNERSSILFAGGGTGGHLYPAMAVAERLAEADVPLDVAFACSDRPIDARILGEAGVDFTPLRVIGLPRVLWRWPGFVRRYFASKRTAVRLIGQRRVACVVAFGGFVSGPVVGAAHRLGVPTILVNLDAVPGKANRYLARKCDGVYSAYPTDALGPNVRPIAVPLPRRSVSDAQPVEARMQLGLAPDRPLLLVVGGSQGARSINRTMIALLERDAFRRALDDWQVMHLAGAEDAEALRTAYAAADGVAAVLPFCDRMGLAWRAAELAISRAGANSVAEVAANRTPTVFLPYPHHADQHQKHNAQPLVDAGGALRFDDTTDPHANADRLLNELMNLMHDEDRRAAMGQRLADRSPSDGAETLAGAIGELLANGGT